MSLKEMLQLLVNQAQHNGFDFQRWFQEHIHAEWPGRDQALSYLSIESRHYALLFSHDFARYYWRTGARISFSVPSITYSRVNSRGEVIVVTRKPFTRRSIKPDAWKYHLRQMAAAEDPVLYLCRFLPTAQQATQKRASGNGDEEALAAD
jgi:hypothetical protein